MVREFGYLMKSKAQVRVPHYDRLATTQINYSLYPFVVCGFVLTDIF